MDLDYYGNDEGEEFYEYHLDNSAETLEENLDMSISDLWIYCIKGTLGEWFDITAYVLLSSCLLRWLAGYRIVPRWVIHFLSTLLGFYCMVGIMDWHGFYAFTFAVFGITAIYFSDWLIGSKRAPIVAIVCLSMIISVGEYTLYPSQWNRIRGSVMVMSMKLISLAMDLDNGAITRLPSILQMFGYTFHTATIVFGPWISFYDYYKSLEEPESHDLLDPIWLLSLLRTLILSTIYLVMSSCVFTYLFERASDFGKWPTAFRDAMIVRMSHYFVCFHGESSAVAGGIVNEKSDIGWNLEIVRPSLIEVPRSLVEVVVHWNRPMHIWLRKYVFKQLISKGRFVAVLATFTASALLHGLSFRLSAVLLSLGFYTYTEHSIRKKLAAKFNACIEARECKKCTHKYKDTNLLVKIINAFMTLLAMFHLSYLGTMFDSSEVDEFGETMNYTLQKWAELGYLSHWIMAITFGVNLIL